MFGEHVTIFQSLQLTVIAMSIVFVVLFVIALIIQTFEHIFPDKSKNKENSNEQITKETRDNKVVSQNKVNISELTNDEEKMIAAFVASMEAAGENKDKNYRITSIKQLA